MISCVCLTGPHGKFDCYQACKERVDCRRADLSVGRLMDECGGRLTLCLSSIGPTSVLDSLEHHS